MIDIDLPEKLLRGLWSCVLETETDGEFSTRPEHLAAAEALRRLLMPTPMAPNAVGDLRVGPAPGVVGAWRLSLSPVARDTAVFQAALVGLMVCGPVATILEWVFTRLPHEAGLGSVTSLVALAAWTWDPFIEEVVKVLPLVVVAWRWPRARRQLGWVDHMLLGAALGAGFALFEAVAQYAQVSLTARTFDGGYLAQANLSQMLLVPSVGTSLTTWLPGPVFYTSWLDYAFSMEVGGGPLLHVGYTAGAAVGVIWFARRRGWRRWLGVLPLLAVGALHGNYNANARAVSFSSTGVSEFLTWCDERSGVAFVLLLVGLTVADRLVLGRAKAARPDLLLPGERPGGLSPGPLLRAAGVAPPWSAVATWMVVLRRRAALNAVACGDPEPSPAAGVAEQVRQLAAADDKRRWKDAVRQAIHLPRLRDVLSWRLVVALVAGLPAFVYLVVGGFPATRGIQEAMKGSAGTWVAIIGLVAALVVTVSCLPLVWKALRAHPDPVLHEARLRPAMRLASMAVVAALSVGLVVRGVVGGNPYGRIIAPAHSLEAISQTLVIVGLVLACLAAVALVVTTCGTGALALAGAGGAVAGTASVGVGGAAAAGAGAVAVGSLVDALGWGALAVLVGLILQNASGLVFNQESGATEDESTEDDEEEALGESIVRHMDDDHPDDRHLDGVADEDREDYIDSVVRGDKPLARHEKLTDWGRDIWQHGKNIIIRDPTSRHGGTAFSKKTVEEAVQYLEGELVRWGRVP